MHPTRCEVLVEYLRRGQECLGSCSSRFLFVSNRGTRLDGGRVHRTFYELSRQNRLRAAGVSHGPGLHDFRQPVFPNARGGRLSAHGVQYLLTKHVATATAVCSSLMRKRVSPHVVLHTTAMDVLQEGVDRSAITLWLGHESIETTHMYLEADLELKQRVLEGMTPAAGRSGP